MPTFAVFIAFAVFSVPGGLLAARIGKKNLLLSGLGLNAAALLIPSFVQPDFRMLLICIFTLGIGTTFLQVAGNPIMRDVSAAGKYSRNLAFAQGIKGIGSTAATYLLAAIAAIAFFKGMGWRAGFPFFCGLMALAFVTVATLKVKETKADVPPSIASSLALLKEPVFLLAVLGIFFYVGAEASLGRFLKPALTRVGLGEESANTWGPTLFFLMLTVGRLGRRCLADDHESANLFPPFCSARLVGGDCHYGRIAKPGIGRRGGCGVWALPTSGPCSFRSQSKSGQAVPTNSRA